ncbi:type II secretion system protein M, partial [Candidatus Binatia bacterium]|nr:type II secretion system protein M [Candidatus Binatia bacterium]
MRRISSVGLGRWMRPGIAISRRRARLRSGVSPAIRLGIGSLLTGWLLLATPAGAQDEAPKLVSHGAQGYSLDANGTPVAQVLTEVGQQAGFTVEAPDTFNSQITVNMQDVPLDQLLRRVLRDENYIIVYRGGVQRTSVSGDKIDKIFLLTQAPAAGGPRPPGNASPLAGPAGGPGPGHA